MRLYAKLGAELAGLKNKLSEIYMTEKCCKCFVNRDIYNVINCQKMYQG